jgi:hypothetical protein
MAAITLEKLKNDQLALAVASALAVANETAISQGADPRKSIVTINEENALTGRLWRIHYGPRDYVNVRGGDLIIWIDDATSEVTRITHGQ